MGKASRKKRENRQQAAGAQAASCFETTGGSSQPVARIYGQTFVGKEQIRAAYESLIRLEIKTGMAANLDALADLGPAMFSDILDVGVELIVEADGGKVIVDPLEATFLLDKEECFLWFFEHARKTNGGLGVLSTLACNCLPATMGVAPNAIRSRSIRLLVRWLIEHLMENDDQATLAELAKAAVVSGVVAEELMAAKGAKAAAEERAALMEELGMEHDSDEEANPEAIQMGKDAVAAAKDSSKAEVVGQGRSSAL